MNTKTHISINIFLKMNFPAAFRAILYLHLRSYRPLLAITGKWLWKFLIFKEKKKNSIKNKNKRGGAWILKWRHTNIEGNDVK